MESLLYTLSKYEENSRWIRERYDELKKRFVGEWVAVLEGKIVDHDKDLKSLVKRLRGKYPDRYEQIAVEYIAVKEIELILKW